MSYFYIQTQDDEVYELTITTDISVTYPSTSTSFPVEKGYEVSDGVTNGNVRVSYRGWLTNIVNLSLYRPTEHGTVSQNVKNLLALRNSKRPFTVYYDSRDTRDTSLPPLNNCVFNRLDFSRQSGDSDMYRCSIDIEQIIIGNAAQEVTQLAQEPTVAAQSSSLVDKSSNSTKEVRKDLSIKLVGEAREYLFGSDIDVTN